MRKKTSEKSEMSEKSFYNIIRGIGGTAGVQMIRIPFCMYLPCWDSGRVSLERSSVGRAAGLYPVRRGFKFFRSDLAC